MGLVPGSGRSPGKGNGNPLQCSCLENPMDRGTWQAIVHRVAKRRTRLKRYAQSAFTEYLILQMFSKLKRVAPKFLILGLEFFFCVCYFIYFWLHLVLVAA